MKDLKTISNKFQEITQINPFYGDLTLGWKYYRSFSGSFNDKYLHVIFTETNDNATEIVVEFTTDNPLEIVEIIKGIEPKCEINYKEKVIHYKTITV